MTIELFVEKFTTCRRKQFNLRDFGKLICWAALHRHALSMQSEILQSCSAPLPRHKQRASAMWLD